MSLLLGSLTIGVILSLLAIGVFISFRIFSFPDMTAEGTVTLGAAVAAAMVVSGYDPLTATAVATVLGGVAGALTGIIHTRFAINALLAGILMMTALYSINLWVMGRSNLPLMGHTTFATWAAHLGGGLGGATGVLKLGGFEVRGADLTLLFMALTFVTLVCALLFLYCQTQVGTAMRATGDNPQMIRALGVSDGHMIIAGLALSNALIALSGALLAQYQGFADVQMGIGMLVWGLASVIIGEALVGNDRLGYLLIGAVLGSILFRLMVAVALRWGLDPNYLKLITAIFVLFALTLPGAMAKFRQRRSVRMSHA
jgi:putative tryptophan/tyrosine transport system permease protein